MVKPNGLDVGTLDAGKEEPVPKFPVWRFWRVVVDVVDSSDAVA